MSLIGKLFTPGQARRRAAREGKLHSFQAIAGVAGAFRPVADLRWRLEREWVVVFLAGVVLLALVAGLYLDVTARAAITGREIQGMEAAMDVNSRTNADIQAQIGALMSNKSMTTRAEALGFQRLTRDDLQYMVVPGYYPQTAVSLVNEPPARDWVAETPEFHESLLVWFAEQWQAASVPPYQVEK